MYRRGRQPEEDGCYATRDRGGVFDGIGQNTSDEDADGRGGSEVDEADVRNIEDDSANVGGGGLP